MPTNKTETDTSATPGHVASTDGLGAVLTYEDKGGTGASGQTIGADGRGFYAVLFYGTPDAAYAAAGEYVRELRRTGRWIAMPCVISNEDSFSGPNVRAVTVGA